MTGCPKSAQDINDLHVAGRLEAAMKNLMPMNELARRADEEERYERTIRDFQMSPNDMLATLNRGPMDDPEREQVVIQIREYKGKQYLDLRQFYRPEDGGEMRPTKKGITVRVRELQTVAAALLHAHSELGVAENGEQKG